MKVLFVEPPKDLWFVMGDYLPPPYGIIQLAAYLEQHDGNVETEVLDCNAQHVGWKDLKRCIEKSNPDIVASSSLATCNAYVVVRTLETAKSVNPSILTVAGGQHFTATAKESLERYPDIDVVVRGEGERTLKDLAQHVQMKVGFANVEGISFRKEGEIVHGHDRPLIGDLEELPYPGYHLVKHSIHKYHFAAMAGRDAPYVLIEGSRGCGHQCTFCTQWRHWQGRCRSKSPKRIVDEMEFCYRRYGSRFIWLTDDNLGVGTRVRDLADQLMLRNIPSDLMWFVQARCDDVIRNKKILGKLRKSGLRWVLLGVENSDPTTLANFKKDATPQYAKEAVDLLKRNDILAHAMFIIGSECECPLEFTYYSVLS